MARRMKQTREMAKCEYIQAEKTFLKLVDNGSLKYWPPMKYGELLARRSALNKKDYPSEKWFFSHLGALNIQGFLRNWPIANRFFGDFYFMKIGVVIEIDGSAHRRTEALDRGRDRIFNLFKIKVIRINFNDHNKLAEVLASLNANHAARGTFRLRRLKISKADQETFFPVAELKPMGYYGMIKKVPQRNAVLIRSGTSTHRIELPGKPAIFKENPDSP